MLHQPFYDPEKTYEENFKDGPFSAFADGNVFENTGEPTCDFFREQVFLPFGIPAGTLVNSKFAKAALDKGFDVVTYKTVRSRKYPCQEWPNVLSLDLEGDLSLEQAEKGVLATHHYKIPLSATNSFGVPSFDPDFWQKDLQEATLYAKKLGWQTHLDNKRILGEEERRS